MDRWACMQAICIISLCSLPVENWVGEYVPRRSGSRISPGEKRTSGDCCRVLVSEWEESGGVGRLERGT